MEEFTAVWAQIAERFKGYDEKLIFESMNEVRAGEDWYCHTDSIFDNYNALNQQFVKQIRLSSGNNDRRYLMLETYGAQKDAHQIGRFWIPSVSEDDHIIASVHWYIETVNAGDYTPNFDRLKAAFNDKGIPCVIGETGLPRWYDDEYHERWATFMVGLCNQYNIKIIIWEDHGNYTVSQRTSPVEWVFPKYVEAIYEATKKSEIIDRPDDKKTGDVDGDGLQTAADVLLLRKYIAGYELQIDIAQADMNNDGKVSLTDVLLLRKKLAGIGESKDEALFGDINKDFTVDNADYLLLCNFLLFGENIGISAADCNNDGTVNIKDLLAIKKYISQNG